MVKLSNNELKRLAANIKKLGAEAGFQQIGITGIELAEDEARLKKWLAQKRHGEMNYMDRHNSKRSHPTALVPDTLRVISARMNYWPKNSKSTQEVLDDHTLGYISRYAVGRDYHKVMRQRLKGLALAIEKQVSGFGYRIFVDSAPVLEKALARNSGLGWIGKHTNLINKNAGSWFFLGELFINLPLPVDEPSSNHCGTCRACLDVCPTNAIIAPYELDARRCISYLTIELKGPIPESLRKPLGNRIYGCDDCQLICPWNKFAQLSSEGDFKPRQKLDGSSLINLFGWTKADWLKRTEGSAIRRAGYEGWLRNIAVALGNAPTNYLIVAALLKRTHHPSALVREHVHWALAQHKVI
ncbi:MAG: tRNA epoxyqueuosine(34) reductase QueG [Gammaproteobacteria bacterium]